MIENKQDCSLAKREEILPTTTENRVLILGSTISGAFKLADSFEVYLKQRGIAKPSVEVLRDAGIIETALTIDQGRENPNLPKGVILLPEMRQYSPTGMGMSLGSYESGISDFVEQLCQRYDIPLIKIREYKTPEQIEKGLKELLEPKEEK